MFRSARIFLQSFPLHVIACKVACKVFSIKIPKLYKWQENFINKHGIEIGGPSGIFNISGYLPLYATAKMIDGVNFSNVTIWEGNLSEGYHYKYYNKTGYQYIAEGSNLVNMKDSGYDFVLSCNNLEHMANPLAAILAVQMMLDWLGTRYEDSRLHRAAQQVEAAVAALLSEGKTLTYDLIGEAKASRCSEVGAAVEEKLRTMA